jgi:tripartite-type tricarboxylate transporter receptor subunit TctC
VLKGELDIISRMLVIVACITGSLSLSGIPCRAETYPDRPVKIIVPNTPGGPVDASARFVADGLRRIWGSPVVIENRPGAGGNIGTNAVAKAEPDGYTLLLTPSAPLIINQSLYGELPFNPEADFAPITVVYSAPLVLTVPTSLPVRSVADLVSYIKARPGQLNYASGGRGTPVHLAGELFKLAAGLDVVHVAYRGGAEMTLAVEKGEVAFGFNGLLVMPMVQADQMRALAVATAKRSSLAQDVPTMSEAGYSDFTVDAWGGLLAPAKTPAGIIHKLHEDTVRVLQEPDIRTKMLASGVEPVGNTAVEFAGQIRTEAAYWRKIIKEANITLN